MRAACSHSSSGSNRGERQQEGEREADAQVDEAGSCRDLDIACTLQKTAGDVGDRAGPDEEHQDVEMFLCAPQGLSGDVEDLEKRPVKKQNYDTDGDTDQDAHQDGGAVAAAGTVQFFSADILSGEAGNGDVKALGRDVRELFDLQHGSVASMLGAPKELMRRCRMRKPIELTPVCSMIGILRRISSAPCPFQA